MVGMSMITPIPMGTIMTTVIAMGMSTTTVTVMATAMMEKIISKNC